jgi:hypothetical protein
MNSAAFAAAETNPAPNVTIPDFVSAANAAIEQAFAAETPTPSSGPGQTGASAPQYGITINTAAFAADVAAAGANGVPNFSGAISQLSASATPPSGGVSEIVPIDGTSWQLTVSPGNSTATGASSNIDVTAVDVGTADATNQSGGTTPSGGQSTLDTIQATLASIADDVMSFLGYINPIGAAEAAPAQNQAQDQLAQQINDYISTHAPNSPLNGMGSVIVADSVLFGVDPRLLVAVAGAETSYGTAITAGTNNIFNNLYAGSNSNFDSVDSAVMNEARMIGRSNGNYFGQGKTTTTAFYNTYCVGPDCVNGLANLNSILNTLGGNVNNLHWTGH